MKPPGDGSLQSRGDNGVQQVEEGFYLFFLKARMDNCLNPKGSVNTDKKQLLGFKKVFFKSMFLFLPFS